MEYSVVARRCFADCELVRITRQEVTQTPEPSPEGPGGWVCGRRQSREVSVTQSMLGALRTVWTAEHSQRAQCGVVSCRGDKRFALG